MKKSSHSRSSGIADPVNHGNFPHLIALLAASISFLFLIHVPKAAAMELSFCNASSLRFPHTDSVPLHYCSIPESFHTFSNSYLASKSISLRRPLIWPQPRLVRLRAESVSPTESNGSVDKHVDDDFIIEDVPHLTDFFPHLPVIILRYEVTICLIGDFNHWLLLSIFDGNVQVLNSSAMLII